MLNHVILHQTIIGQEALLQMEKAGHYPDVVIGCFGGGSNFSGLAFPFIRENLKNGKKTRCLTIEPSSCPKLTKGKFMYDFGDSAGMTPLLPMYTLGHNFIPDKIHAGGLRYHGAGVLLSQLKKDGLIEAKAKMQRECFEAGVFFARAKVYFLLPNRTMPSPALLMRQEKPTWRESQEPYSLTSVVMVISIFLLMRNISRTTCRIMK